MKLHGGASVSSVSNLHPSRAPNTLLIFLRRGHRRKTYQNQNCNQRKRFRQVTEPAHICNYASKPQGRMEQKGQEPVHVLLFPVPAMGHVIPMLKLAELLSLAGLHVTFLNTDFIHGKCTDLRARLSAYPGFQFKTISDGLPTDHPRSAEFMMEISDSLISKTKTLLREMLVSNQFSSDTRSSVTCIVVDNIIDGLTSDLANELRIPVIYFEVFSICSIWTHFYVPNIIEAGELPIRGNDDMDRLITTVPGMESFLRCRDLPSPCRDSNLPNWILHFLITAFQRIPQAHALILNTFEDLEGPILSRMLPHCPEKVYTIGPLHAHLNVRLEAKGSPSHSESQSSNSVLELDRSCMAWLDGQPLKSVVYVSFGTFVIMTKNELMELWYGLVNSKKGFLLVIRPSLVNETYGEDQIPAELAEATKERGCIVGWAPQLEVLDHPAVGAFLMHCGWNTLLEGIVAGVPMICWPFLGDQLVNSRFVSEVWKLGLDMKDVADRVTVEKMVNDLMGEKREEFTKSTAKMSRLARQSVSEGGSSYRNLDRLIEDLRSMNMGKDETGSTQRRHF